MCSMSQTVLKKCFHNVKYTILHINIWGNKQDILPWFLLSFHLVLFYDPPLVFSYFSWAFHHDLIQNIENGITVKSTWRSTRVHMSAACLCLSCGWFCPLIFSPLIVWGQVHMNSVSLFLSLALRHPTATNRWSDQCLSSWTSAPWDVLLIRDDWTQSRGVCYPPCSVTIWWALGSLLRGSAEQLTTPRALRWQHHLPSAQLQQPCWSVEVLRVGTVTVRLQGLEMGCHGFCLVVLSSTVRLWIQRLCSC